MSAMTRLTVSIAALCCFASASGAACLPEEYTVEAEGARSAQIVVVHVLSERPAPAIEDPHAPGGIEYTVRVVESLKNPRMPRLRVFSENDSGKFLMEPEKQYLLFLRDTDGRLSVDVCGNSGPAAAKEPVIQALEKLQTKKPE